MNNQKMWFTLVELIIVITILSVLSVIWFVSFSGYTKNANDSKNVYNVKNIEKWLNIYSVNTWRFPKPDNITWTWVINNVVLNYSWKVWSNVWRLINLAENNKWDDVLYWVSFDSKSYQLATFLHEPISQKIVSSTYANSKNYAHVSWNYDGMILFNSWSGVRYIANLPSLIFESQWTVDILQNDPLFIADWLTKGLAKNTILQNITGKNVSVKSVLLTWNTAQVQQLSNDFWIDSYLIGIKIFWKNFQLVLSTQKLWIYYWWPSSLNNAVNGYRLDNVINDLNQYNTIVLWAWLEVNSHSDHNNTRIILNGTWWWLWYAPSGFSGYSWESYWYISLMRDIPSIQNSIQGWKNLGVDWIFFDEAWYDFLVDNYVFTNKVDARNHQINAINLVHEAWLKVIMNSWVVDDVFGTSFWESATTLRSWDSYLLESFVYNPHAVATQYYDYDNQLTKLNNSLTYKNQFWINLYCVWLLPNAWQITQQRIQTFYDKSLWVCSHIQITEETFWAGSSPTLVNYLKDFK